MRIVPVLQRHVTGISFETTLSQSYLKYELPEAELRSAREPRSLRRAIFAGAPFRKYRESGFEQARSGKRTSQAFQRCLDQILNRGASGEQSRQRE